MFIGDQLGIDSREIEVLLCASAFVDEASVLADCSHILPGDFSDTRLASFWKDFLDGKSALSSALDNGVVAELVEVGSVMPTEKYIEYARKLSEYVYLRNIANSLPMIARAISEKNILDVQEIVENIRNNSPGDSAKAFTTTQVDESFRNMVANGGKAVKTFMKPFDDATGGLYPSELIVLAGRPGMGKTTLCLNIARNIAFSSKKVLFFSLEMTKEQLWAKMACPLAGVQWRDVRGGSISPIDMQRLELESVALAAKLSGTFFVHDEIYSLPEMSRMVVKYHPDIVVIDQLPDISWHGKEDDEIKWYGAACHYARTHIAKRRKIPVLLIHQISREVETRSDKRPILKDLRWSGEVEQRSDVVLMTYREDYYEGRPQGMNVVPLEVWVRKNRQGEMSQCIVLKYDLSTQVIT